ncbi:Pre-mRNA processing ribonucleoprotein, binding domain protein [Halorubrum aidingense JCM 13560]|uniref:Pre-mRNA processing ribonucleoprotein, binding domain protein n=1 Tax=Halorubrum aidingense JCM 13560 TaxID=1230454 RepID=M0PJW4_9EURY|nr:NOP5/NOP56 family protein [Halorubrum aidingense]EMA69010.1 Pre-mRNA processing ribonucleoprotein, binding domain protein [Halorubrum aidingense JCM 13560]
MTDTDADAAPDAGWFVGLPAAGDGDSARTRERIATGSADEPRDWPRLAVDAGFAETTDDYYDRLHDAALDATRETVRERERADDQQLVHAVRAMDDCERTANELAERAAEWAGSLFDDAEPGIDGARAVAEREPEGELERRAVSLAARVADLADERDALAETIDRLAPAVAPNLAEMAGPELAARLIALAGGLESLAKKPSGTVQVLGAEDALFAHLSGRAPSPKHGIIYTHDYVRNTRPEDRGSASRALAGKLTLAARVDHYSGERRAPLHDELRERMATIRARAEPDRDSDTDAEGDDE